MAKGNGTGQGGKTLNDRKLAAEVRTLTLRECMKHLKKGKGEMYEQVLLRLASTVLPRLNEHAGANGEPLSIQFDSAFKK